MSVLRFIAELVKALAWPCVAVVAVVVFRAELRKLIPLLRRVKLGPVEAEWAELASEAQAELKAGQPPVSEVSRALHGPIYLELAESARGMPIDAVVRGYQHVRSALVELSSSAFPAFPGEESRNPGRAVDMRVLMSVAERNNLITGETASAVDKIVDLHNVARHRPDEISVSMALEYLTLCDQTVDRIRNGRHWSAD